MPVTLVKTQWESGILKFLDSTGSTLFSVDSTGKGIVVGSKGLIDFSAASGLLKFPVASDNDTDIATSVAYVVKTTTEAKVGPATTGVVLKTVTVAQKVRVDDVHFINLASGSSTHKLRVGTTSTEAITDNITANNADQALMRATQINDANWIVSAGGTIKIIANMGSSQAVPAMQVLVRGTRSS